MKGKKKRNKNKGGTFVPRKPPGFVVGSKASVEFDEDPEKSDKDEEEFKMSLEEYLTSNHGICLKTDLKASALSMREELEEEIVDDYLRGRDIIFLANKIREELADFMKSCN